METMHLWEPTTPDSVKTLFESLQVAQVNTVKSIRLWKIGCGDEGIKGIVEYLA